jgi:acyl-CoA thioesterase-1
MRRALAVLMAVALIGCSHSHPTQTGGQSGAARVATAAGASAPETPVANAGAALPESAPVIVAFGDSLTAGYGTDPGQSYPDYLQRDLFRNGYAYRVVNKGVSGNTSKDGLARLPDVIALRPAMVIVAFGGNDGLRGLPAAQLRANLDAILATLKQTHTKIVLAGIEMPPNYGEAYTKEFATVYPALAKKYGVPLAPFLLAGAYGKAGSMQADGLHATAKGNEEIAQQLLPIVERVLGAKQARKP